jgi:hypothetical protein
MDKVLATIGLGIPAYLAVASFSFFRWLDRNASAQAKRALAQWLQGRPYKKIDLDQSILRAFDLLYAPPLRSLRTILRSATISSIVWLSVWLIFFFYPRPDLRILEHIDIGFLTINGIHLASVIISDYLTIRRSESSHHDDISTDHFGGPSGLVRCNCNTSCLLYRFDLRNVRDPHLPRGFGS